MLTSFLTFSYDAGIQTFDTADIYSNGLSEIILGKAIKKYDFPRDEIVVMTKLCGVVGRTPGERYYGGMVNHEEYGYVNQIGSSRKVSFVYFLRIHEEDDELTDHYAARL